MQADRFDADEYARRVRALREGSQWAHDELRKAGDEIDQRGGEIERLRESVGVLSKIADAKGAEVERLREALKAKLDDMQLHDGTGDPHDKGYMAAVDELPRLVRRRLITGLLFSDNPHTGPGFVRSRVDLCPVREEDPVQ